MLKSGEQFRLLATNKLDDASVFNATPAVHRGHLLLRSDRCLYCIGAPAASRGPRSVAAACPRKPGHGTQADLSNNRC